MSKQLEQVNREFELCKCADGGTWIAGDGDNLRCFVQRPQGRAVLLLFACVRAARSAKNRRI